MKTFILSLTLCFFITSAFNQTKAKDDLPNIVSITVPDFADPEVKAFYQAYSDHLIKCIKTIREKNESKVTAYFGIPERNW